MATSGTSKSRYSWEEIKAIFIRDLTLPEITDDATAVKDAIASKTPRYQQMADQPEASKRVQAKEWFKRTSDAESKLPDLLAEVRGVFEQAAGVATVPPELKAELVELGAVQFQLSQDLARRWVDEFIQRHRGRAGRPLRLHRVRRGGWGLGHQRPHGLMRRDR